MKNKNKIFFFGVAFVMMLALVLPYFGKTEFKNADALNYESVSISNGDFNSSKNSYYLDSSPSGWQIIKSGVISTSGIINTNSERFDDYRTTYQLANSNNPETMSADKNDTKVLMLNPKSTTNPNGNLNQGFKSNDIALAAYGYYSFTVLAKVEVGGVASIYLKGLDNVLKFENISNTTWKAYTFFVENGPISQNIHFELWLGNDGAQTSSSPVFFDNLTGKKLAETQYNLDKADDTYHQVYTVSKNYITGFENANFENGLVGWTANGPFPAGTYHKVINTKDNASMNEFDFLDGNNLEGPNALWLASKQTPSSSFGFTSSKISLPAFAVYKISFMAKVGDDTTATVVLKETDAVKDIYSEYEPKTTSLTVNSNDSSNNVANNYKTYSFYVCGHTQYDTEIFVELWLGTESEAKSGSVLFDDFTIEKISKTDYTNTSTGSNVSKLELKTLSATLTVPNGTFNLGYSEDADVKYPAEPSNWTKENPNNQTSGIINTNTAKFDNIKDQIGGLANPGNPKGFVGTDNEYNNVLMLWNKTNSYQSILSDSLTVDKNDGSNEVYYKLAFAFKTLPSDSESVNFNLQIVDQNSVVIYEAKNINSTTWENFELYIKNGYYTTSLKVRFSLGTASENAKGYAFVDNVTFEKQSSMTSEQWNALSPSLTTKIADFTNCFVNTLTDLRSFDATLNSEQPAGEPVAQSGLVDSKSNEFDVISNSESQSKNMIYIKTIANANYSLKSNFKAKLLANTQYRISFFVKTMLHDVPEKYEENYGLGFELENTNGKFENIKTNGEWVKYTMVVNTTDEVEAAYKFVACNQNINSGLYFIDEIKIEKLDSTTYNSLLNDKKNDSTYYFVGSTDKIDEDTKDTDDTTDEKQDFDWILIPSIISAVALIIALVGFIIRRLNIKKRQKKMKTTYDRKQTLYKDVIRKQARDIRDEQVKDLNIELKEIEKEIEELDANQKELLANQRKAQGKQIDKQTEKAFKSYASKHTSLENKKEKIVNKIKELNSADYLLTLQKKITNDMAKDLKEQNKQQENSEENK